LVGSPDLQEVIVRALYIVSASALLLAGAGIAYLPSWQEAAPDVAVEAGDAAATDAPANPAPAVVAAAARRADGPEVATLLATLRRDREACYLSGDGDGKGSEAACTRVGYHQRALVRLGAVVPPGTSPEETAAILLARDTPGGEDVVARYLRLNPEDASPPDEINQNMILLDHGLEQDRAACFKSDLPDQRACELIGLHERGLSMFGAIID
jgi:hypothetical protein